MRKSLFIPLLLPLAGLGLLQGIYWYQVKVKVDDLADQFPPLAELRYETVIADFDGTVGIEGVSVRLASGGELQLERAVLKLDSWTRFLSATDELLIANWPEHLGFALSGVRYKGGQKEDNQSVALALQGCGIPPAREAEYLQALGLDIAPTDIQLRYRFNPDTRYINLETTVTLPQIAAVEAKIALASPRDIEGIEQFTPELQFSELSIAVHNDSLVERITTYCAGLHDEQPVAFVNRHVELLAQRLNEHGFVFSSSLLEGYREFWMTPRGDAKLQLIARDPLPLNALPDARYADDFKLLATVNGKRVEQLRVSWAPVAPMPDLGELLRVAGAESTGQRGTVAEQASGVTASTVAADEAVTPSPVAYPRLRPRNTDRSVYEVIEAAELVDHIGDFLQVDTLNGHRIEGELESLPRGQMRILQKLEGGVALLPIRLELVRSIKVRR